MRVKHLLCQKVFVILFLFLIFGNAAKADDKIGIVPFKVYGPFEIQYIKDAIPEMLFSRLPFGDKEIIKKDFLKEMLKGFDSKDELQQAKQFLAVTDFTIILIGSYTKMGDAFSIDLKVLKREDKEFKTFFVTKDAESKLFEAISSLSDMVYNYISKGKNVEIVPATSKTPPASSTFVRQQVFELKNPVYGIALADLNGDGKKELVCAGYSSINVYDENNAKIQTLQTIQLKGHEIIHLDAGDFNKNGKDEIYVTTINLQDVVTYVYEYGADQKLQNVLQTDWYIRTINHPEHGNVLIGQRMGFDAPFGGEVYFLDFKSSGIFAKSKLETKKSLNLFQFLPIKYKGKSAIAFFNDGDYLKIADEKGKVYERLKEPYGGSSTIVVKGIDEMTREQKYTPISARLFRVSDGDTDMIFTLKNEGSRLFSRSKKFDRGSVVLLRFNDINYTQFASSEILDGYLSDFWVDFSGNKVYVSVKTDSGEGRIIVFKYNH